MIEQLFSEALKSGQHVYRFRVIRPVYEDLCIGESIDGYQSIDAISAPATVYALFSFLRRETKEHLIALHLDSKNHLICLELVSVGSLSASIVHPREVFKSVLLSSAAAFLLIHNHPSGDTSPSVEDIDITARLKKAADLLGIRFLDHVIIGSDYCSMAERGYC